MTKHFLLLLLSLWFITNEARAEYFTITRYAIDVTFAADGSADFVETIEVSFSERRHGIFRFIPYRDNINGSNVDRLIKDVDVDGFKFSTSKENTNLVIKIGDADTYVEGMQTYRIRYHVVNALNFFDDKHSEFYWDLLGTSWPVVIENVTFKLSFPDKVNLTSEQARSFSGAAGSSGHDVEVQVKPRSFEGKTTRKFMPEEGLTVAVFFPAGAFEAMSDWSYFLERHGLLLAPFFFIFAGLLARFMARNRPQTIMTEYFPPDGISPAIAGGFVDHSVDSNDVLCLIPHLANQGYLRLEAKEGGFLRKSDITFYKLKEAGPELFEFEKEFFNALFATGHQVRLQDLKDKFHTHLTGVQASVKAWIMAQGWYEPDQKAMGCMTGIGGLAALGWGGYAVFAQQNLDGFALIATGLLLFYFASRFNKRSPAGNKTYQRLEGFRQFVKKAERPVIERLMKDDPLYYDKTMPYALAFGYLKQWNHQFEGLLTQPPSWYGAPGMHGAYMGQSWNTFSESFPSEINSIGSVFSSAPSSSGSGGGGGGGFSGGGSGGGGGGSW
jgi:uncharacterized membrane protein